MTGPAELRRRRVVVAVALVLGTAVLGLALSTRPGDAWFYLSTLVAAVVWTAGGLLAGPLPSLRGTLRRPVLTPLAIGLAAGAVFLAGALVVREIPPLRDLVQGVLAYADRGTLPLVLAVTVTNGVAEEIFFRGALFAAIGPRSPVLISTAIYALVTVATANPMLVFAAATLGAVLARQRQVSGTVVAPAITHVTWSTLMLFALPPLFG
jgi:membrane protease YdiL (CAAX protease family)